jgi:hypothetical protein
MRRRQCLVLLLSLIGLATAWPQDDAADADGGWDDSGWDEDWDDSDGAARIFTGFFEAGVGSRWDTDPAVGSKATLQDLRWRVETEWLRDWGSLSLKADVLYDGVDDDALHGDFRDLTLALSPAENLDVKLGRQVLTWGTGDLLFLNDLFPKDFVSFFAGRDDEYLKAPSNSARFALYGDVVNMDFAWTPVYTPDEFLTGERFSFFFPLDGAIVAPVPPLAAVKPDKDLGNGEFALRVFKTLRGVEYAGYAYRGYFKQPNAFTDSLLPTFAPLTAIGASLRRTLGAGLINAEFSYYLSRDDRSGSNPLLPNDQLRLLVGYEREAITNLTVGFQWYLEWTQDYSSLLANSPFPQFEPEEQRHVLTNRLSYRALREKLTLSLFTFYSPSDRDFYFRPQVGYRYSDQFSLAAGANLFGGQEIYTFFGQLEDNSNIYARIRFNY